MVDLHMHILPGLDDGIILQLLLMEIIMTIRYRSM